MPNSGMLYWYLWSPYPFYYTLDSRKILFLVLKNHIERTVVYVSALFGGL